MQQVWTLQHFVLKTQVKRPLGRPICNWEDNIKFEFRETGCEGMDWIHLAEDKDQWRAFISMTIDLLIL
jgi:hypothetical protein